MRPSEVSRKQADWLASLPSLQRQGDGMRSFAGALIGLLVHPKSMILLDEPEAFLHPPHVRKLASVIAEETSPESQMIVATHDDNFVRALLDHSGDRVTVARLVRSDAVNNISILPSSELVRLWIDPVLRTTDVLSALFHEAAILCEGDSDARFYGALLDEIEAPDASHDTRLFSFGGKDKIGTVVSALRAIKVPVVAIVDIDVLSDVEKFLTLFERMGGSRKDVRDDVVSIGRTVSARRPQISANELATQLRRVSDDLTKSDAVTEEIRRKLLDLTKVGSNWVRIKEDGYRGLVDAASIQAFERVAAKSQQHGLLINPEGELEGFCRQVSRSRKGEWLATVLERDIANDPALDEARKFARRVFDTVSLVLA